MMPVTDYWNGNVFARHNAKQARSVKMLVKISLFEFNHSNEMRVCIAITKCFIGQSHAQWPKLVAKK